MGFTGQSMSENCFHDDCVEPVSFRIRIDVLYVEHGKGPIEVGLCTRHYREIVDVDRLMDVVPIAWIIANGRGADAKRPSQN